MISPGPGHPKDARLSLEMIERFYHTKPILGVCLGHQCIAYAFGNPVQKGLSPIHGKTAKLHFQNSKLFQGISLQTQVMRYHSLCVPSVSAPLEAIAWSEDDVMMALQHQSYPLYGVQFHPESILTQEGEKMIENFLQN